MASGSQLSLQATGPGFSGKCLVSLIVDSLRSRLLGNDYFDDVYIHNGKEKRFEGYSADVFFNEAIRFMSESAKSKKPFMCYLATNTPHGPFWPKEEDRKEIAEVLLSLSSITWIIISKNASLSIWE